MQLIQSLISRHTRTGTGRIFISYRRDDAKWPAGRLADSLSAYFGDGRVFRDIEDIAGGANFSQVIHATLQQADAMLVVIGRGWLNMASERGTRRLEDDDDWIAQEIAVALEEDVPIYPVLVEDAPMPRADELPDRLKPLARHNAISISDHRWAEDVERLAKIVALDIPSATERTLNLINLLIATALFVAVTITTTAVGVSALDRDGQLWSGPDGVSLWDVLESKIDPEDDEQNCTYPPKAKLLELSLSGLTHIVIVASAALLFVYARLIDRSRRGYAYAAAWSGALGSLLAFLVLHDICKQNEPIAMFFISTVTACLMLALMCLSGFRAK